MGASESTARTNGTTKDEERHQESSGDSIGNGTKAAIALAAAGVAAWQFAKMLSENQEKENAMKMKGTKLESSYLADFTSSSQSGYESRPVSYPIVRALSSPGPYKMNTDGSCRPNQGPGGYVRITPDDPVMKGPSGYGGILRDDSGKWVRGFIGFIESSDCLTIEIHGIYKGLLLLDKLGLQGSILESDCEQATNWIIDESYRPCSQVIKDCWDIITECKRLIHKNKIIISWCSRDANKCADKMAAMAVEKRLQYVEIMDLPNEIKAYF